MPGELHEGDEILEMPGSTHRRTWEVVETGDDTTTIKLIDQAVGYTYATEDVTLTAATDDLERSVEDGVLIGSIVKQAPDWERVLVPPAN